MAVKTSVDGGALNKNETENKAFVVQSKVDYSLSPLAIAEPC
jgi:hypothetical protein